MTWFSPAVSTDGVFAVLPACHQGFNELYNALWTLEEIPAEVLELCRLRIAQLHRCDSELQRESHPLPAAKREHLADWPSHAGFSDAERACLALCEVYTADPQAITDPQAEAVKTHYGEAGYVALAEAMGLFYGLSRLGLLWGLPQDGQSTGAKS